MDRFEAVLRSYDSARSGFIAFAQFLCLITIRLKINQFTNDALYRIFSYYSSGKAELPLSKITEVF